MNYDTLVGITCILACIIFTRTVMDIFNALYKRYSKKWYRNKWEDFFVEYYETMTGRYDE